MNITTTTGIVKRCDACYGEGRSIANTPCAVCGGTGAVDVTVAVGDGCTYNSGSDRYAATVVSVSFFKTGSKAGQVREVVVQDDDYTLVSGSIFSESQVYEYERNTNAATTAFRPDRNGHLHRVNGYGYCHIGERRAYRDPSF